MADALPTGFRGSAAWVHSLEGNGLRLYGRSCYWPRGASGVTLDPGFDLGYQLEDDFQEHYTPHLTKEQIDACMAVMGVKGEAAGRMVRADSYQGRTLRSIKIPTEVQQDLFDDVAEQYWTRITARFPALMDECCPGAVQTAMWGAAYNRGAGNPGFDALHGVISQNFWGQLGKALARMQQRHPLSNIRLRRRREAALILQPVIWQGMDETPLQDAATRNAQWIMREHDYYRGAIDGAFGPGTTHATEEMQRAQGIGVDGVIGSEGWGELVGGRDSLMRLAPSQNG